MRIDIWDAETVNKVADLRNSIFLSEVWLRRGLTNIIDFEIKNLKKELIYYIEQEIGVEVEDRDIVVESYSDTPRNVKNFKAYWLPEAESIHYEAPDSLGCINTYPVTVYESRQGIPQRAKMRRRFMYFDAPETENFTLVGWDAINRVWVF